MKNLSALVLLAVSLVYADVSGQVWNSMASGLGNSSSSIKAIAVNPVTYEIYAGGTFTSPISYLAKWNGSSWEQVGTGINGPVYSLAFLNQDLYAGGDFNSAGGISVNNIAKWSAGSWSDVSGGFNGVVKCIYISPTSNDIYAGGSFTMSGTTSVNHLAKLVSSSWTALGSGISSTVNAFTEHSNFLHAGCENLMNPVQKFDGSSWTPVSGISSGKVYALASYQGFLYAGGDFSSPTFAAARFDGNSWLTINTTFSYQDVIYSYYKGSNNVLYIGGKFSNLGIPGSLASNAAKITSASVPIQSITQTSSTIGGEVYAINSENNKPIVGGNFSSPNTNIAITSVSVGIDKLNNLVSEKVLFPNPVYDRTTLRITTKETLNHPSLSIFDLQGRSLPVKYEVYMKGNQVEFVIDCSSLSSGNYTYALSEDEQFVISDKFSVK